MNVLSDQEQKCQSNTILHRVAVVSESGQMLGYGRVVSGPWDPGTSPGDFNFVILVAKEWRKSGIGKHIYDHILQFSKQNGAKRLSTFVYETEQEQLNWLERLGFAKSIHTFNSVLDLQKFDPHSFSTTLQSVRSTGLKFATLADYPDTDEMFSRFFDVMMELTSDVPNADRMQFPDFDTMKYICKHMAPWEPSAIQLIVDDHRWVAMSVLTRMPDQWYNCVLTGVDRDYRGRGLALAVKVKSAEYAKNNGGQFIRTYNDSTNDRILRVNQRMGFAAQPGQYTLDKMV
ncbi:GNAT family N-acetyltransferase [Alicyclobacillus fodiniaquatilis]|uniref:GNAT family N-acetyltransferase n=1 Tax=Alicyclobacillus fodiniaquatilis TaxID=1661150 RepID=A0ABW4JK60_9BACL